MNLKAQLVKEQNGRDAINGKKLRSKTNLRLVDKDRKIPRTEGGKYTKKNTRIINPETHMERHGNLRERSSSFQELKDIIDERSQIIKLSNKINNQLLAYERKTDTLRSTTEEFLKDELKRIEEKKKEFDKELEKQIKKMAKEDTNMGRLIKATLTAPGVGPVTVAYLTVYIDLDPDSDHYKANPQKKPPQHPSSLWKYVGLDKPSHERYTKGISGGGNKTLRTQLHVTADSMIKGTGAYRKVYDQVKTRLENSLKIVKTHTTEGKLVECAWKDTKPSHRHGSAQRIMIKHFLADYWYVGRIIFGLPTSSPYVQGQLGHTDIIRPEERGWKFEANAEKKPNQ
ncbi:MAG TPA: IS110 family transposase [Methanofastidiosum sp.]|nr:IS110 family transposase [Methanofastidiosum sp.]